MKKNGFTLVEIVVTIVIISLLAVLLGNRISSSNNDSKQRLYDSKIEVALSAARSFGTNNLDLLSSSECYDIEISRLISLQYLASDSTTMYEYLNPIDNTSLRSKVICIKYVGGKVEATLK